LKADNSAPTPENVRAKLRSNMNGHREEFKMYKANGKDDGAFIDGTLYRTKAGYSIFANAPNEIEKSISQAGFAGMGLRDLERKQGAVIDSKLHMALAANGPKMWAVAQGAAVDGSFAIDTEGNQGYYVNGGKELFLSSVANMKDFFKQRAERLGKPIKYIIKPGIGGQHTPFQAIADSFQVIDAESGIVTGEYQLGKDYESAMAETLRRLGAAWGQVAVIPSSKSGSTDETMMIFSEILYVLLKHAVVDGVDGGEFADSVFDTLHEVNFIDGKERATRDLFKVEDGRFGTASLIDLIARRANERGLSINRGQVKDIFAGVLGNMVFETVNNSAESRLAAFINNSKLGDELGEDRPRFTTMFDNVGGRWTADLHMMTFLAYHNLDAGSYWTSRYEAIKKVREGGHVGVRMAGRFLDEDITDIALVVPDELFWFGKAIEQNFNESIWQEGFANLVAVKESLWEAQKANYADNPGRFVINLTGISIPNDSFNIENLGAVDVRGMDKQRLANSLGELFTTFYGMTHTVGNELLARAVILERQRAEDIDMENPANPAANIIRKNLYLFQPYVELGKKLLDARLQELQKQEAAKPGTIEAEFEKTRQLAREGRLESDIPDMPAKVMNVEQLTAVMLKAKQFADRNGRKFAPFIYLEGGKFYNLRDHLSGQGIEWVMQGTGDQHISFQQVLSQPQKYLPFVISLVPERALPGRKAIGFGKGYLNDVSPHMVRDYFAEASYRALVELRKEQGGLGLFLRMTDSEANLGMLRRSAEEMRSMIEKAKIGETPVTEAIPAARFVDLTSARPGMAGKIAPTLGDRVGEIESSVRRIAANLQLYPENTVPSGDIVIITKSSWVAKGTKGEEAADNSSLDSTAKAMLKGRYEAMIQGLREAFPNNRNIVGVSTQDELIATISDLVNNQRVKVVVLDDGALTTGIDTRLGEIAGQAGKDYCVVAADLSEKPVLTEMKFINLNAMALMGAAILSNNGVLFTDAYNLFTGEEPPQNLIADGRINWFVKALPRIVPFDVNKADDQRLVNKLFRVSAKSI
ncbi:MAG: hypothetical protein Q8N91_06055, partial [Candidatus Omnitrophota bacterium]|nr:hypothetical protein [Candidatus Omnitrophota bacterium]